MWANFFLAMFLAILTIVSTVLFSVFMTVMFGGDVMENFTVLSIFWLMFIVHIKD